MRADAAVVEQHPARALDLQEEQAPPDRRYQNRILARGDALGIDLGAVGIGHQLLALEPCRKYARL